MLGLMPVHTVWMINKAGGLSYQRTINDTFHPRLTANDYLIMASSFQRYNKMTFNSHSPFHSIHAISAKVSPVPGSGGIKHLELILGGAPFRLHCLQSPTGVKVLMTTTTASTSSLDKRLSNLTECEAILRKVYVAYTDYALKNPFHTMEMPIKSDAFDDAVTRIVS